MLSILEWHYNPLVGQGGLIIGLDGHASDTTHSVRFLWTGDATRRRDLLSNNTEHSQETDTSMPPPGGIRARNLSKRSAADPSRKPRGHRDLHKYEA